MTYPGLTAGPWVTDGGTIVGGINTGAEREVTGLRSHSQRVAELGEEARSLSHHQAPMWRPRAPSLPPAATHGRVAEVRGYIQSHNIVLIIIT